ncbi:MAG: hypothetical protein NTY01_09005 [Verrucomicrobia bacterium]|nr:hypothetical protein [Verrucomicrobiota bacterium]
MRTSLPILSCFIAAVAAFALTPLARAASRRLGFVDDPGHRKIHAEPMALLGGVARPAHGGHPRRRGAGAGAGLGG